MLFKQRKTDALLLKKRLDAINDTIHYFLYSIQCQIRFEYMVSGMVGVVMLWILEHEVMKVDNVIQQLVEIHFENDMMKTDFSQKIAFIYK